MDFIFSPVVASALWIGGGSLGLLLIVVCVPPLLRRKPLDHPLAADGIKARE
jgi:hypothetical protein